MKLSRKNILSIICIFCLSGLYFSAFAESSVWRVEKNGRVLYLGGTVHKLRKKDFPLPIEFEKAFENSSILVLEVNPGKLNKEKFTAYIREHGMYQDERSLKTVLSAEVYGKLEKYCQDHQLVVEALNKFKPSIAILTLMALTVKGANFGEGVDLYFYHQSLEKKHNVLGLETAQEQVDLLVNMGEGNESKFVEESLKDLHEILGNLDDVISAWRSGDVDKLYKQHVEEMEKDAPKLYQSLILDRNKRWLPQIEKFMKTPEVEFVLVGDAHLVGPQGLLEALRKNGYRVTPYSVTKTDLKNSI